jgi:hypothetical protein
MASAASEAVLNASASRSVKGFQLFNAFWLFDGIPIFLNLKHHLGAHDTYLTQKMPRMPHL